MTGRRAPRPLCEDVERLLRLGQQPPQMALRRARHDLRWAAHRRTARLDALSQLHGCAGLGPQPSDFVGIENYLEVLSDFCRFWPAVARTFIFTIGALVVELVLGMCIALLLWRPFKGEKWVRVAILLPLVATPVAVGMMWRLIFDPNIGFANQLLAGSGSRRSRGCPVKPPPCQP